MEFRKKNERLFYLIKSLSRAEKRHFILQSTAFKSSSHYLELFRFMAEMDYYDEDAIRTRFKGATFLNQFHVIKNYLIKMILKSLRAFHDEHSRGAQIKNALQNVEILYNKEQHHLAFDELKRAKTLARQYENFPLMLEAMDWERKLSLNKEPGNFEALDVIQDEQSEVLGLLENQYMYNDLILDVSKGIRSQELQQIKNIRCLEDVSNAFSFEARIVHLNASYFLAVVNDKQTEAERILYYTIEYIESQDEMVKAYPGFYATTINNFIGFMVFNKKLEECISLIQKAKTFYDRIQISGENRNLMKQILRTYNLELEIYRNDVTLVDSEYLTTVIDFVEQNAGKMPKSYLLAFWYQFSLIFFKMKQFGEALKWINLILNSKYANVRQDIIRYVRILNLMTHYELGNDFVFRYFLDSSKRFFKRFLDTSLYEDTLLHLFTKLARSGKSDHRELFKECFSILDQNRDESDFELSMINYKAWVLSKS